MPREIASIRLQSRGWRKQSREEPAEALAQHMNAASTGHVRRSHGCAAPAAVFAARLPVMVHVCGPSRREEAGHSIHATPPGCPPMRALRPSPNCPGGDGGSGGRSPSRRRGAGCATHICVRGSSCDRRGHRGSPQFASATALGPLLWAGLTGDRTLGVNNGR